MSFPQLESIKQGQFISFCQIRADGCIVCQETFFLVKECLLLHSESCTRNIELMLHKKQFFVDSEKLKNVNLCAEGVLRVLKNGLCVLCKKPLFSKDDVKTPPKKPFLNSS